MDAFRLVLATEKHKEAVPVVLVHPSIEQGVDKCRAHGPNMEDRVQEFVLMEDKNQIKIDGKLEYVEGEPTDCKYHNYHHEHFGGLPPPALVFIPGSRTDMVFQLEPDPGVGITNNCKGKNILQEEHGQTVDGGISVVTRGPFF